jgi:hypothetical protein
VFCYLAELYEARVAAGRLGPAQAVPCITATSGGGASASASTSGGGGPASASASWRSSSSGGGGSGGGSEAGRGAGLALGSSPQVGGLGWQGAHLGAFAAVGPAALGC